MADSTPHKPAQAQSGKNLNTQSEAEKQAALEAAAIEAGRLLFAAECQFFHGAQKLEQLPLPGLPEVAFAGRSNVGKSSLVNALTGHNTLARTSSQPGRTRQLNFFDLGARLTLVDMPGYGYAQAAKEIKADWQGMMFDYLRGRPTLQRVYLLIDARHGVKDSDHETMKNLDSAAVSYRILLTKTDQLRGAEIPEAIAEAEAATRKHGAAHPEVMATSSESGFGIPELRVEVLKAAKG